MADDGVTADAAPAARPSMQQQSVRITFGALMLVMLLASLDQTIVSTALPTIVGGKQWENRGQSRLSLRATEKVKCLRVGQQT